MAQREATAARYAFATLLTTDEYLPAALVVAHSLRTVHASSSSLTPQDREALSVVGDDQGHAEEQVHLGTWPSGGGAKRDRKPNVELVAIVTPETLGVQSIRSLLAVYDRVVGVETVGIESILAMQQAGQIPACDNAKGKAKASDNTAVAGDVSQITLDNLHLLDRPDLGTGRGAVLTKLHAWRLTQYEKVLFLDADTLVLQPLAHLFASAAAFAAAPDTGWPDIFNSGVMLLTPSNDHFEGMLRLAAENGSWDGADQGLINEYFGGEVGSGGEGRGGGWSRLPFIYNTTALGGYTYAPAFARYGSNVKVAHFIGADKPWRNRTPRASSAQAAQWWAVYNAFYASQPPTPQSGADASDVEVRITERGAEIIQRPRPKAFEVPVYQSAWDSLGSQQQLHGNDGRSTSGNEGRYESLPLYGRVDLIAPKLRIAQATQDDSSTRTPTHSTPSSSSPSSVDSQHSKAGWDATQSAPPLDSTPAAYQMRNPPETYFTNVWDKPAAQLTREERERRRHFLNPNLRSEYHGQQQPWGHIPPEARHIHTYSHLSDKPDEKLVKPVFPWEQQQTARRGHDEKTASSATRTFPDDAARRSHHDPSLGVSTGDDPATAPTRKFDDHGVYTTQHGGGWQGSPSQSPQPGRDFNSANLIARYANVWDTENPALSRASVAESRLAVQRTEDSDRHQENRRQGHAGAVGRRSRKGTRSSGGIATGADSNHRPSSAYVPNVYDDYVPAPRAPLRRSVDLGRAPDSDSAATASQRPRSNLTTALMARQLSDAASNATSLDDSIYGAEGSGVYDRTLARLGGATGGHSGGVGEVEGSSSWSMQLSDLVRLGDQPGEAAHGGGGPAVTTRGGHRRGRLQGEEDDGDDETSSDESRGSGGSRRGGGGSSDDRRHGGTVNAAASSPQLAFAEHLRSHGGAGVANSGYATAGTTASDYLTVPEYSSAASGHDDDDQQTAREREGPGYMRKAQANSFVRSHITPRSPRHSHHPLLGTSTTGAGATPATTIAVGSHSSDQAESGAGVSAGAHVSASTSPTMHFTPSALYDNGGGASEPPAAAPPLTGRARIRPDKAAAAQVRGPSAEYGYGEGWLG